MLERMVLTGREIRCFIFHGVVRGQYPISRNPSSTRYVPMCVCIPGGRAIRGICRLARQMVNMPDSGPVGVGHATVTVLLETPLGITNGKESVVILIELVFLGCAFAK